jgi:hypothetical protein
MLNVRKLTFLAYLSLPLAIDEGHSTRTWNNLHQSSNVVDKGHSCNDESSQSSLMVDVDLLVAKNGGLSAEPTA